MKLLAILTAAAALTSTTPAAAIPIKPSGQNATAMAAALPITTTIPQPLLTNHTCNGTADNTNTTNHQLLVALPPGIRDWHPDHWHGIDLKPNSDPNPACKAMCIMFFTPACTFCKWHKGRS